MNIQAVEFVREQGATPERGIMINNDELIIDKKGEAVENHLWNYALMPFDLCINIDLGE